MKYQAALVFMLATAAYFTANVAAYECPAHTHGKQKICECNGGLQICIHKLSKRQRFYDLILVPIQRH